MRLPVLMLPALLAAAPLVAAMPASAATRDWPLRGFDRVQLVAPAEATITAGPGFAVHADGEDAIVRQLTAEVRDGTLYLSIAPGSSVRGGVRHLRFEITLPKLAGAGVKGVGSIVADRAEAALTVFALEGTGSIKIAAVRADKTVLSLSGTGSIEVAGTTGQLDARRSGVGSIDAGALHARSAVLVSSGIGSLDARVDGPANVTQSGIGSVTVLGHPTCTVRHSGIGSVDCK